MSKFNINDKIKIKGGMWKDQIGIIKEYFESDDSYKVVFDEKPFGIVVAENNIEKVPLSLFEKSLHDYEASCDEAFFEMATVKWGFMSIKLSIYGDEGEHPHFHFYKGLKPEGGIPKENRSGGGCICIKEAKYFIHKGHKDTMTPQEIKGLIKFLNERNKTYKSITNWEYIIGQWNDNNPDKIQLSINMPIPDYRSDMGNIIGK